MTEEGPKPPRVTHVLTPVQGFAVSMPRHQERSSDRLVKVWAGRLSLLIMGATIANFLLTRIYLPGAVSAATPSNAAQEWQSSTDKRLDALGVQVDQVRADLAAQKAALSAVLEKLAPRRR